MPFAHSYYLHKGDSKDRPKLVRPTIDTGKGLTKQSFKKDRDINVIVNKYQRTGVIEFANKRAPEYMQMDEMDFQDAMQKVVHANEVFSELPAAVRKKFNNDPGQFMAFVHDPANEDEMVDMGLAVRRVDPGADGIPDTPDDVISVDKTPGDPAP